MPSATAAGTTVPTWASTPSTPACAAVATATCTVLAKSATRRNQPLRRCHDPYLCCGPRIPQQPHLALAGLVAGDHRHRPAHQAVDPWCLPTGRLDADHGLLQHRAGPQHGRGLLVPGRSGRLAALADRKSVV